MRAKEVGIMFFFGSWDLFISSRDFVAKREQDNRREEVVLPAGSNIVKDWHEVARYVSTSLPVFPLFIASLSFFLLSSSFSPLFFILFYPFTVETQSLRAIRLFRQTSRDRNAMCPPLRSAINSRYARFFSFFLFFFSFLFNVEFFVFAGYALVSFVFDWNVFPFLPARKRESYLGNALWPRFLSRRSWISPGNVRRFQFHPAGDSFFLLFFLFFFFLLYEISVIKRR